MKFNEFSILPVLTRQKARALAEQNQNHEFESVAGSSFIWPDPPPAERQKRSIFKSFRLLRKSSSTAGNSPRPNTPPPAFPPESAIPTPSEGSEVSFCDHTGLEDDVVYEDVELNYENAEVSDGNLENDPEYSEESSEDSGLQQYGSKIDFEMGIIELFSEDTPLVASDLEACTRVCSVHADFSFVIPPQSEVVVSAKLDSVPQISNVTGIVAPRPSLPEKYSVFGASELVCVSEDGTIPVRMINPSFQPVKIYRRTRLGDFEEVNSSIDTFELNSMEYSNSSPSSTDADSHHDYSDLPDLSDSVLSHGDKIKFKDLFRKYRDVFAFSDDQLGRTSLVQHTIDTGDAAPIKQRPYRTTPENKQEIDRQVSDMLQKGIVQESVSPWSSPVVLVKKKNGKMRFCIDFRMVNKITKKDSFPMPLVADTLDALSGTQFFTTLDLKSGYWQIQLHPSAREKTAFVTHNGLYEFLVMPFGLTNSGASFQRLMGHILRGLEYRFALIYIDDIIIFSKSVEEHLAHLEEVFRRLREANVKLNPSAPCKAKSGVFRSRGDT